MKNGAYKDGFLFLVLICYLICLPFMTSAYGAELNYSYLKEYYGNQYDDPDYKNQVDGNSDGIIDLFDLIVLAKNINKFENKGIIAFGDSNTANPSWVNRLDEFYSHEEVLNKGIGGNTTFNGRMRFEEDVIINKPRLVLIMFGTNDATLNGKGLPQVDKVSFRKNLQFFIDKLKEIKAEPILMTTIPLIEGNGNDGYYYSRHIFDYYVNVDGAKKWHNSYNDIVRELAIVNNLKLIDNWNIFVQEANGEDDWNLIQSRLLDSSGTHMTQKGAELIFQTIKSVIK